MSSASLFKGFCHLFSSKWMLLGRSVLGIPWSYGSGCQFGYLILQISSWVESAVILESDIMANLVSKFDIHLSK